MNNRIDHNKIIETQQPMLFPDNLDSKLEDYTETIPFRDLPIDDYKITSKRVFKTKDKRDCLALTLISRNQTKFIVYAPDLIRDQLKANPNTFNYLRNLGLKQSKLTDNHYFDFRLA